MVAEYTEPNWSASPQWAKNYIHFGGRVLATQQPGAYGEFVQYHHPDRLGTRLVSNAWDAGAFEQNTLPFGVALDAESTGATNRRFTTFDRSSSARLDYAVNRHYDPLLGRFLQPDPLGMRAVNIADPQTLNLYSYCANNPVNRIDPDGLLFGFLKKLFGWIGKIINKIIKVLAVVTAVVLALALTVFTPVPGALLLKLAITSGLLFALGWGPPWLQRLISAAGQFSGSLPGSRRRRRRGALCRWRRATARPGWLPPRAAGASSTSRTSPRAPHRSDGGRGPCHQVGDEHGRRDGD